MSNGAWPSRNIDWCNLQLQDEIEERDSVFILYRRGIPYAVVCWGPQDAVKAQNKLKSVSFARCMAADCNIRVTSLGDICGTCLAQYAR